MEDAWQTDMAPSSAISIPKGADGGDAAWNGADRARGRSRSRSPVREGRGQNPGNNLHVSGLAHRLDSRDLEDAFSKVGRVQKASVMLDPHTRDSRGFGFVTMESAEEAEAAVTALNGSELGGKAIRVEKARRGRARTPTPGKYFGPPKRGDGERPYDPRPYDSRYSRDYDRRGGRYDDRSGRDRDYGRGRDYDRYDRGGRDDPRDRDRDRERRDYDRDDRGGARGYDDRRY